MRLMWLEVHLVSHVRFCSRSSGVPGCVTAHPDVGQRVSPGWGETFSKGHTSSVWDSPVVTSTVLEPRVKKLLEVFLVCAPTKRISASSRRLPFL